jgi:uncharacterized protein YdaT
LSVLAIDPQERADNGMPWTGKSFAKKHNHSLSGGEAKKAASQASAMVRSGVDEGIAIATANKHINKLRKRGQVSDRAHQRVTDAWGKGDETVKAATA